MSASAARAAAAVRNQDTKSRNVSIESGKNSNRSRQESFDKEATITVLESDGGHCKSCPKRPYQERVGEAYLSNPVQLSVAFLIFFNFVVSAVAAQIHPQKGTQTGHIFFFFEWFFGLIFTVELVWNMYGTPFHEFWISGWNWFDFIIVTISLMALTLEGLPGIGILRLFRAFRVFRLFKRVESLRVIIEGVLASIPGVLNAFMVLGILMGIWSIMGVEFFGEVAKEDFGNFGRGMWSMWQTMTMDSWSSGIARPIIFGSGVALGVPFFLSFIFIGGIVMTNVVVAILLDKYLEVVNAQKEAKAHAKEQNRDSKEKDSFATDTECESPASDTSVSSGPTVPPLQVDSAMWLGSIEQLDRKLELRMNQLQQENKALHDLVQRLVIQMECNTVVMQGQNHENSVGPAGRSGLSSYLPGSESRAATARQRKFSGCIKTDKPITSVTSKNNSPLLSPAPCQ